jgi:Bacterial aa3 type cytochrome c oxidase subunit IV
LEAILAKATKGKKTESAIDFAEHERTYEGFLWLTRWMVVAIAATLIAMVAGFFGGFGFWAILIFAILMLIAYFLL